MISQTIYETSDVAEGSFPALATASTDLGHWETVSCTGEDFVDGDETIETCGNLTAECISEGEVLYKNVDPDSTNVMYGSPTMIPSLILNKECALEPVQCKPIPPPSDNEGEDGGKQCLNPQTSPSISQLLPLL